MRNYDIGNHTCKLCYSGDDYYKPFNQTLPFEISNVAFIFKEIMYDYENIKVEMPEDATGTVSININGTKKRYNVDYIPGYDTKSIIYELDNLKYGTYNLEITYSGNYGNITKKANFTKDYSFYLYDHGNLTKYVNNHDFLFFMGVTNKITVLIDGVNINYDPNDDLETTRYTNPPNYYDGMLFDCAPIWLNRISMSKGYHTLEVKYSGDKTRPAKTIRDVFYLNKPQLAKFNDIFVNSNYPINFIFSANTTGNITAYTSTDGKNYKFFARANIANNNAKINIP